MSTPAGLTTQADITEDLSLECGVVIVGSGAGGATVAADLAEAGADVVVLEEGGYHPTESFRPETGRALRTLYRDGGGGATIGRPSVLFAEGRCVGGSTVVNGGMSWRTPAGVLDRWAKQDGVLEISEAEMAPYFARFEARNSVGTQDPETIGRNSLLLKAGADAEGWAILPNRRNQLHCAGTSNCSNGCPTGAKRSMAVTSVPRALAFGARIIAGCRVDRVTRSGHSVTGVTGHVVGPGGVRGPRVVVRARAVIVAAGSIQTPALLLRSGLGSASGQLGRNLSLHPNANVVAFFDSDVTGWQGVHQAFQIREFLAEGIMMSAQNLTPSMLAGVIPGYGRELGEMMADYNRVVTAGPLIEDTGTGRVRNVPGLGTQVFYRVTDKDAARVVRGVELTAEALFAAGARRVVLPFNGAPDVRDPADLRRLLTRPVPRRSVELYSIHLMGTARMSEDPRRGVVDSYGAFHGVRGLFVCDASVFPGPIGINPMETVIALAMRNARRLIEQRRRYALLPGLCSRADKSQCWLADKSQCQMATGVPGTYSNPESGLPVGAWFRCE
ncbi:MAG TPA: GMC family oxidoreductase [Streptosporangiaceae bacterium]|nr:GMC family oxidoreductase [Streptosporangiaceae bacterium]